MERWLPSEQFPAYEISDLGRIRNSKTRRILKTHVNDRGYETVCLRKNKEQHNTRVHQLVAHTFHPCEHDGLDVNHIDGDKCNNSANNLEWCTRKENIHHAYITGLKKRPETVKVRVVETGDIYESLTECSKAIHGDRNQIRRCLQGKERTCRGYHFETV